ncbi:hypothetical protein [Algisphaera agarilytica]|uniref:DUF2330 domain-containing protein n=1 Tax=Algisphaera agarilytica TaxID=1385975 RepID=A0A7X0LMM0_9BACT|nr:hypothetical protein [Algisphaera agarilytica]MBB6431163.1 hypothetical protein [Algisphaera agarilytica]
MSRVLCFVLGCWLIAGAALAQLDEVRLDIEQGYLGLDGYVRPGTWTPIRLSVDNLAADDRDVIFRWEHRDEDGDRVSAERLATLTRQRDDQPVWLYAAVPMTVDRDTRWNLRAVDAESGELLAAASVQPNDEFLLRNSEQLIAVTSTADLGLNDYQRHTTQQAPVKLVRGLSLPRLPDRWQGLEALSAFVWTQDLGGDPADPLQVSEAALLSLREWVMRGGHLVVMLPEVGQTWTSSPLADMLPVTTGQLRQRESTDWPFQDWIGTGRDSVQPLTITNFNVGQDDPRATVVLRDDAGEPVVVAGRYGFGRVTVIGMDLTSASARSSAVFSSQQRLWNHVFNWRFPVLTEAVTEGEIRANRLFEASRVSASVNLIGFVPERIAMSGTVGALLLGAIFLFGLYWLVAGWLIQPILKSKGLSRFSWVGFVALVAVFAGIAWAGAAVLRPGGENVSHVTVLDYDGNSGVARGRAFVSIFVPDFGTSEVATDSPRINALATPVHNLISSPGFSPEAAETGFVDTQRYSLDAAQPDAVDVPVRSTSKQFMLDYLGPVDGDMPGLAKPFSIGVSDPIVADDVGWPTGEVRHTLPGTLSNVRVIYCPGERVDQFGNVRQLPPQVWSYVNAAGENRWSPDEPLVLAGRPDAKDREVLYAPFRRWPQINSERDWKGEGFLGRRLGEQKGPGLGNLGGGGTAPADESVIARHFELLTFFDALPPPDVKRDPDKAQLKQGYVLTRLLGQRMDLTPLTQGRRVIILAHLRDSPLPVPLTLDGQTPSSQGWTVVRWVYDF